MKAKIIPQFDIAQLSQEEVALPASDKVVRFTGPVNRSTTERVLRELEHAAGKEITLFVSSAGGPTGVAMSFFDTLRHLVKPKLTTVGSGDVDSSGVLIFMSGDRRYLTKRTTMLLHPAGRVFGNGRYTAKEMAAMLSEDRLKDEQYAELIAERSHGKTTSEEILALMEAQTVLTPERAVELGIADAILP